MMFRLSHVVDPMEIIPCKIFSTILNKLLNAEDPENNPWLYYPFKTV